MAARAVNSSEDLAVVQSAWPSLDSAISWVEMAAKQRKYAATKLAVNSSSLQVDSVTLRDVTLLCGEA